MKFKVAKVNFLGKSSDVQITLVTFKDALVKFEVIPINFKVTLVTANFIYDTQGHYDDLHSNSRNSQGHLS